MLGPGRPASPGQVASPAAVPSLLPSAHPALVQLPGQMSPFDEAASDPHAQKQPPALRDAPRTCLYAPRRPSTLCPAHAPAPRLPPPGPAPLRASRAFPRFVSPGAGPWRFSAAIGGTGKAGDGLRVLEGLEGGGQVRHPATFGEEGPRSSWQVVCTFQVKNK